MYNARYHKKELLEEFCTINKIKISVLPKYCPFTNMAGNVYNILKRKLRSFTYKKIDTTKKFNYSLKKLITGIKYINTTNLIFTIKYINEIAYDIMII